MFKSEDPVRYKKTNQVSKTFVNVASLGTWTSLSKLNWKLWRLALTASDFHNSLHNNIIWGFKDHYPVFF